MYVLYTYGSRCYVSIEIHRNLHSVVSCCTALYVGTSVGIHLLYTYIVSERVTWLYLPTYLPLLLLLLLPSSWELVPEERDSISTL